MRILKVGILAMPLLCFVDAYGNLSNADLETLLRADDDINIQTILAPLLRPRIPGTLGSEIVRKHIIQFFNSALPLWKTELQESSSKTPISGSQRIPFVNIIAYRSPPGVNETDVGWLTLVAHYDSLKEPEGFIGAIDSAAPCSIIMNAVRNIDAALSRKWDNMSSSPADTHEQYGIQVIFTDGEESFANTLIASDGLYGSRSLAAHWAVDKYPSTAKYETRLSSISLLVLLDLLGSKNPQIGSYYPVTHSDYQRLAALESRLRELGQLKSSVMQDRSWFVDRTTDVRSLNRHPVEDDQVPFSGLGVKVLHVIDADPATGEFPSVWHTHEDDENHLDLDTIQDWSHLITAFAAEWLELQGYMSK
ncbi:hypothetical protein BDV24DRAFT_167929 [Aspergillus arachidicola]|uniref:Peptide hydrolase n=1 Tax=Aspergillus arachidicola TaxID=656916 RepID=A0A5N6XUU9_9EURO|nr:hypothetical protein BDV24DRAFT_167929 [Aspergillus arachidicola]